MTAALAPFGERHRPPHRGRGRGVGQAQGAGDEGAAGGEEGGGEGVGGDERVGVRIGGVGAKPDKLPVPAIVKHDVHVPRGRVRALHARDVDALGGQEGEHRVAERVAAERRDKRGGVAQRRHRGRHVGRGAAGVGRPRGDRVAGEALLVGEKV